MKTLELEEIQAIGTQILERFCAFCDRHNLKYVIDYGTLLGAVRHKGFIPWDDDIDVIMPRDEYNRFLYIASTEKIAEHIEVSYNRETHGFFPFMRIVDTRTITQISKRYERYNTPIWIDVFPIDGCPNSERTTERMMKTINILNYFRLRCTEKSTKDNILYRRVCKNIYLRIISPYMLAALINRVSCKYKYEDCDFGKNFALLLYGGETEFLHTILKIQ